MKFDSTNFYAALTHELKNSLGLLSMTIDSIPLRATPQGDDAVDSSRLLCQAVVDRLQQAASGNKAANQPICPRIDAYSPYDLPCHASGTGLGLQFSRLIAQSHDNNNRTGERRTLVAQ